MMVSQKHADLGFNISKFGKNSMALRFNQKPVFVFNIDSPVDEKFLSQICEIYLTISEKRNNRAPVKSA
jgi:hypothetical protein